MSPYSKYYAIILQHYMTSMCSASKQADTNQVNIKYMDQTQKSVCVCVKRTHLKYPQPQLAEI